MCYTVFMQCEKVKVDGSRTCQYIIIITEEGSLRKRERERWLRFPDMKCSCWS